MRGEEFPEVLHPGDLVRFPRTVARIIVPRKKRGEPQRYRLRFLRWGQKSKKLWTREELIEAGAHLAKGRG